jgi:hypothetical protein
VFQIGFASEEYVDVMYSVEVEVRSMVWQFVMISIYMMTSTPMM